MGWAAAGRIARSLGAREGMPCDVKPLVPLHAAGVDRGGGGEREKGMRLGSDGQGRLCPVGHGVCSLDLGEDLLGLL
jgi:hypothetical protein